MAIALLSFAVQGDGRKERRKSADKGDPGVLLALSP
jgi:hypothetical protein